MAVDASLLVDPDDATDPANTNDEKAHREAFQLIMQGFSTATHTLWDEYQWACKEVQTIVRKSLRTSTALDRTFVCGASATIRHWVRAVHPAMDCLGESIEEQLHLLQEARKAGKEATEDILNLLLNCPKIPFYQRLHKQLYKTPYSTLRGSFAHSQPLSRVVR